MEKFGCREAWLWRSLDLEKLGCGEVWLWKSLSVEKFDSEGLWETCYQTWLSDCQREAGLMRTPRRLP